MNVPLPNNGEETAYLAFAMIDELVDFLVNTNRITGDDRTALLQSVSVRLSKGGSRASQRASEFIANRMKLDP